MKKKLTAVCMAAAVCIGIMAGTTACGSSGAGVSNQAVSTDKPDVPSAVSQTASDTSAPQEPIVGADPSTWSPFTDCESLAEAEDVAGFKLTIPESIEGFAPSSYAVMKEYQLIQVDFNDDDNHYICIRKAIDDKDISGDYNVYNEKNEVTMNGIKVTLRGNDGKVCLATWTNGEYTFSIMYSSLSDDGRSDAGLSQDTMMKLVSEVR